MILRAIGARSVCPGLTPVTCGGDAIGHALSSTLTSMRVIICPTNGAKSGVGSTDGLTGGGAFTGGGESTSGTGSPMRTGRGRGASARALVEKSARHTSAAQSAAEASAKPRVSASEAFLFKFEPPPKIDTDVSNGGPRYAIDGVLGTPLAPALE